MASGRKHNTPADIAGASFGTAIIGITNLIPDGHPTLKSLVIYSAPLIAVLARYFWLLLTTWINRRITKRALAIALREARAMRDEILKDPNATKKHQDAIQEQVEKLEKLVVEIASDDVKHIRARLSDIPS